MKRLFRKTFLCAIAIGLLLATAPVFAQETSSSIVGTVVDATGAPLPGVQVEAEGPLGKLVAISDTQGEYRFPRAQPGTYQITTKLQGFQDSSAGGVRVTLGVATTVDFTMQEQFSEEIVIYSDTIGIDFTESQVATSVNKYEIDFLPRGRNFTDVVSFAPGTVNDPQAGGISIDGASGLENRYIIDGIDTTDPQIGDDAVPMRAEMFEEVQVKSAGYAAEYGGSTGGVINAVTRSGANEFHGAVFVDYENESWNGSERPTLYSGTGEYEKYGKDDETRWDPGFFVSGPILRDRLWFFASYQPGLRTTKRTVEWSNAPADTYTQDFQVDYGVVNVTANISSNFLFKLGAQHLAVQDRRPAARPQRPQRTVRAGQLCASRTGGRARDLLAERRLDRQRQLRRRRPCGLLPHQHHGHGHSDLPVDPQLLHVVGRGLPGVRVARDRIPSGRMVPASSATTCRPGSTRGTSTSGPPTVSTGPGTSVARATTR